MVLDHLIVESLDNNEEKLDVQALLLHGLKALFEDTPEKDIKYDDNDIEKLLDRSQFEETVQQSTDEGALGSFKTARIWANSTAQLEDLPDESNNDILEIGYWDQIIQERLSLAEAQKLAAEEEHGRGRRRASKKVLTPSKNGSNFRSIIDLFLVLSIPVVSTPSKTTIQTKSPTPSTLNPIKTTISTPQQQKNQKNQKISTPL
jgi:hypothetical protein